METTSVPFTPLEASLLSRLLVALGDPTRQRILVLLSRERLNVGELTERFPLSRPAMSHQLKILADAGLLVREHRGRERVYRVDAGRLRSFVTDLDRFVSSCCAGTQCC